MSMSEWMQKRIELDEKARRRISFVLGLLFLIIACSMSCFTVLASIDFRSTPETSMIRIDDFEYAVTCENLLDGPIEVILYKCEIGQEYETCEQVFVDWDGPPCPTEMELQLEENVIQIYGYSYYDGRRHLMFTYEMQSSD